MSAGPKVRAAMLQALAVLERHPELDAETVQVSADWFDGACIHVRSLDAFLAAHREVAVGRPVPTASGLRRSVKVDGVEFWDVMPWPVESREGVCCG